MTSSLRLSSFRRHVRRCIQTLAPVVVLACTLVWSACEGDTIYLPPRGDGAIAGADTTPNGGADTTPRVDSGAAPGVDSGAGGADATATTDGLPGVDTGRDTQPPAPDVPARPDTGPRTCLPNDDGVVSRDEVVLVFGAVANYLANAEGTTVAVDPDGAPDPDHPSQYVWDFRDGPRDVQQGLLVDAMPADAWYADRFPADVTYVTPLGPQTPDILGVFRFRGDQLEMLGLASRSDGPARTILVYDEPVVLYRFPLEEGRAWTVEARFSDARISGAPQAGVETYRFTVDRAGTALLPNFTFTSVLRIRLELTQTFVVSQGHNTLHSVHYFYFTECVGEVARIVGPLTPTYPPPAFTEAREYRRLGL